MREMNSLLLKQTHRRAKSERKRQRKDIKRKTKRWTLLLKQRWDRHAMPSWRDVELEWWRSDEQLWLAAADAEHTHTHTHTSEHMRKWGRLMMRERELPCSSTEDSRSACCMDNTVSNDPTTYSWVICMSACVCVFVFLFMWGPKPEFSPTVWGATVVVGTKSWTPQPKH